MASVTASFLFEAMDNSNICLKSRLLTTCQAVPAGLMVRHRLWLLWTCQGQPVGTPPHIYTVSCVLVPCHLEQHTDNMLVQQAHMQDCMYKCLALS